MALESYKCPNCDGPLKFSPEKQKLVCEYCGGDFTEQELTARQGAGTWEEMEEKFGGAPAETPQKAAPEAPEAVREETKADGFAEHMTAYSCPSCGAEVLVDDTTTATDCFYCHNPVVIAGRMSGDYRPQRMVPFSLDRQGAASAFRDWCKKKWFIDKHFYADAQLEKMAGVYLPFWLVDSKLDATLTGTGAKIRVWRAGDMEYTETKIYRITRAGQVDFTGFPIAALSKRTMELVQGVYPFDFGKAIEFSMPYLSGFQAEKRTKERQDVEPDVHRQMESGAQRLLENTVHGYGSVSGKLVQTAFRREDWRYCLLPAWILTYQYRDKTYYFAMNGQSGKICGDLPLNKWRVLALALGVSAALFLVLMIGGLLL